MFQVEVPGKLCYTIYMYYEEMLHNTIGKHPGLYRRNQNYVQTEFKKYFGFSVF